MISPSHFLVPSPPLTLARDLAISRCGKRGQEVLDRRDVASHVGITGKIILDRSPCVRCSPAVDLESPPLVEDLIKKNTGSDRDIDGVTAAEHR